MVRLMFVLITDNSHFSPTVLTIYEELFFREVSNEIIFTVSGGAGARGLGEALENGVRPLVEGGELKCLEGADGQTRERIQRKRRMEPGREG